MDFLLSLLLVVLMVGAVRNASEKSVSRTTEQSHTRNKRKKSAELNKCVRWGVPILYQLNALHVHKTRCTVLCTVHCIFPRFSHKCNVHSAILSVCSLMFVVGAAAVAVAVVVVLFSFSHSVCICISFCMWLAQFKTHRQHCQCEYCIVHVYWKNLTTDGKSTFHAISSVQ